MLHKIRTDIVHQYDVEYVLSDRCPAKSISCNADIEMAFRQYVLAYVQLNYKLVESPCRKCHKTEMIKELLFICQVQKYETSTLDYKID